MRSVRPIGRFLTTWFYSRIRRAFLPVAFSSTLKETASSTGIIKHYLPMADKERDYPTIKDLWPSINDDELEEARHNLREYVKVCLRIHNRLENQRDTHEDSEEQGNSPSRQPDTDNPIQRPLI